MVAGAGGQDQLVVGFPIRTGVASRHRCAASPSCRRRWRRSSACSATRSALLAAGSAVALLLALLAGVLLTSRALRPLQRLTATSQQLAAGDLRARSGVEGRHDEIGTLARSFDDMAARIEQSFAAQQASEERTRRFIADASHELRTPITALKGYIDVIRRGATPEPKALDAALEAMAREAERMRVLVLDLLTLARLDAQQSTHPEVIDLSAAVAAPPRRGRARGCPSGSSASCRPAFWPASTATRWPPSSATCWSTPASTRPGAPQRWRTYARGRPRLHRGRATRARASPPPTCPTSSSASTAARRRAPARRAAAGSGLSIVQGLARANRGDVAIDSAEGRGTTVTVWFPAAIAARRHRLHRRHSEVERAPGRSTG